MTDHDILEASYSILLKIYRSWIVQNGRCPDLDSKDPVESAIAEFELQMAIRILKGTHHVHSHYSHA